VTAKFYAQIGWRVDNTQSLFPLATLDLVLCYPQKGSGLQLGIAASATVVAGVSGGSPCLINSAVMAGNLATPIMIPKVVMVVARACQLRVDAESPGGA
jgi:hypothetical protein